MSTLVQNKVGFSKLKQTEGFSLVELMVVVAIIGILSAVAVPSVNKYMAKARQTEAKANLSMYYGVNKVFYTEYGIFDTKFTVIGFKPEGRMRYNVGHTNAGVPAATLVTYGYTTPPVSNTVQTGGAAPYCKTPAGAGGAPNNGCQSTPEASATPIVGGCPVAFAMLTNFTACASGKITNRLAAIDVWSIDNNKTLINVADGTE